MQMVYSVKAFEISRAKMSTVEPEPYRHAGSPDSVASVDMVYTYAMQHKKA